MVCFMANGELAYITPEVIAWARNLDDITIEDAAKAATVKNEKIIAWENGEYLPTINQAKKLAKKYRVPYVLFFLPSPPDKYKRPRNADYRTFAHDSLFQNSKSRELSFLLRDVMDRRDAMVEMYYELKLDTVEMDTFIDLDKSDELSISTYIRELIGLNNEKQVKFRTPDTAFHFYLEAFENMGILIFQATGIDLKEMRGMSIYENIFPIIVVNRKDEVRENHSISIYPWKGHIRILVSMFGRIHSVINTIEPITYFWPGPIPPPKGFSFVLDPVMRTSSKIDIGHTLDMVGSFEAAHLAGDLSSRHNVRT